MISTLVGNAAARLQPPSLRREYGDDVAALAIERLRAARRAGVRRWVRDAAAILHDAAATSLRARTQQPSLPSSQNSPSRWSPEMLSQDLKFALRAIRHRPLFAATIVLALAMGIGANALIYSVVDAIVINPFDFPDPDQVIAVGAEFPRRGEELSFFEAISAPELEDVRTQATTLEGVVGFDLGNRQIMGSSEPQNVFTAFWWGDPLATIGLRPLHGRSFIATDVTGREAVALISERVWRSRFAGDPAVIGSTIRINDDPYVLIGVFPTAADFYGADLWTPMWADPNAMPRNRRQFNILARPAAGASIDEINAELDALSWRVEAEHVAAFEEYAGWQLRAFTWTDAFARTLRPAAFILLGAVAFVLLLVCANVASLLLSRASGRQLEIGVRAALGAGHGRIVRQLMAESLVLAGLGMVAGVALAWFGLQWVAANIPANAMPTTRALAINVRVLGFSAVVSVLAGLLFGLAPAWHTARADLHGVLKASGSGAAGGHRRRRLQDVLVGVEVALALLLLCGAGVFITSLNRLQQVDPGVVTDNVLTMRLTLPWSRYEGDAIAAFFEDLAVRVEALPGVVGATAMTQFPPIGFSVAQFSLPGQAVAEDERLPVALLTLIADDALEMLGIPLLAGRHLGAGDRADTPPVLVINERFAHRMFGDESPLGKQLKLGRPGDDNPTFEVVGVVADTRNAGLDSPPNAEAFASLRQAGGVNNQIFLLLQTEGDPRLLLPSIRETVAAMDPDQPIYSIATMDERFASGFAVQGFAMVMLSAFALLALTLAAVGIASIVSWGVAARGREIGVRMALGASGAGVRRLVIRQALLPVLIGGLIGLGLGIAASLALTSMLPEVDGIEPLTLAGVTLVMLLAALGASALPARRASRIDPVTALRSE